MELRPRWICVGRATARSSFAWPTALPGSQPARSSSGKRRPRAIERSPPCFRGARCERSSTAARPRADRRARERARQRRQRGEWRSGPIHGDQRPVRQAQTEVARRPSPRAIRAQSRPPRGRLTLSAGQALVGVPVSVTSTPRGGGEAIAETSATTGPTGRFKATVRPGASRRLLMSYAGVDALAASQAPDQTGQAQPPVRSLPHAGASAAPVA